MNFIRLICFRSKWWISSTQLNFISSNSNKFIRIYAVFVFFFFSRELLCKTSVVDNFGLYMSIYVCWHVIYRSLTEFLLLLLVISFWSEIRVYPCVRWSYQTDVRQLWLKLHLSLFSVFRAHFYCILAHCILFFYSFVFSHCNKHLSNFVFNLTFNRSMWKSFVYFLPFLDTILFFFAL